MNSWFIQPIAELFGPDTIWILIPLTALMIPIVAVLVSHQQKMAQIIHGGGNQRQLDAMRDELEMVKQQVQYQASLINEMKALSDQPKQAPPRAAEDLQSRVGF